MKPEDAQAQVLGYESFSLENILSNQMHLKSEVHPSYTTQIKASKSLAPKLVIQLRIWMIKKAIKYVRLKVLFQKDVFFTINAHIREQRVLHSV